MISELEEFSYKTDIFPGVEILRKWSEVRCVIRCFESGFCQAGDCVISDFDVGEIFPIFHEDIVFRLIFLDHIGLEHECLDLSQCLDIVYAIYLEYHLFFREIERSIIDEVRSYTGSKIIGFTDIQDTLLSVAHDINTGTRREPTVEIFFCLHLYV